MFTTRDLFDLTHSIAGSYLSGFDYPWQALKGIQNYILELGSRLGDEYTEVTPNVWVHKTAVVAPTAYLGAPCIIGAGTEVRHCAFVRGSALIGANCVVTTDIPDNCTVVLPAPRVIQRTEPMDNTFKNWGVYND